MIQHTAGSENDYGNPNCQFINFVYIVQTSLVPQPIAPDPRKQERLVVLELELRPVVRQLVVAPEPFPNQLVVLGRVRACRTGLQREVHRVHVARPGAFGLDVEVACGTGKVGRRCGGKFWRRRVAQAPAAAEGVFEQALRRGRDGLAGSALECRRRGGEVQLLVVLGVAAEEVHVLFRQMVDDFHWLRGRQERDAGPVAEEAEVAVVCHDVDGAVPRHLGH